MIESLSFQGLPDELKDAVFSKIKTVMTAPRSKLSKEFSYFGETERKEINEALRAISARYAELK